MIAGNGDLADTNQDMNLVLPLVLVLIKLAFMATILELIILALKRFQMRYMGFGSLAMILRLAQVMRQIVILFQAIRVMGINGAWQYGNSNISVENNHIGVSKTGLQALGNHGHHLSIVNDRNLTVKNNIISANFRHRH